MKRLRLEEQLERALALKEIMKYFHSLKSFTMETTILFLFLPLIVNGIGQFDGLKTYCRNIYYQAGDVKFGYVTAAHRDDDTDTADDACLEAQ